MRTLHHPWWFSFLLAAGMTLTWGRTAGRPQAQGEVKISFSIPESTVSLHEPVYITFSVHNGSSDVVRFDLGLDGLHNFQFDVIEPDGRVVRTPRTRLRGEVAGRFADRAPLPPGKTYTKTMLLNGWYEFRAAGNYVVEASLDGQMQTVLGVPLPSVPPQQIPLQILPRDSARLKAVCDELTKGAMNANVAEASRAALALSYVDDPIAVPYLGQVLEESFAGKEAAIIGLTRVGNLEAVQVLTSYSKTADPDMKLQIENALREVRSRGKK